MSVMSVNPWPVQYIWPRRFFWAVWEETGTTTAENWTGSDVEAEAGASHLLREIPDPVRETGATS